MSNNVANPQQAFHRGTDAVFSLFSGDQLHRLADLPGDPQLARRLTELAEKANEGELTAEERGEYEGYIEANNLLAVIQAEARFRLTQAEPS